ncbi:hypothetical protein RFI_00078 [Reticulomyxa filosa]|uniref:Uncharacterized protein n=1 Tax=Reticulomyxa filosa TaxID=46433 RepID=X6PFK3_RETFI|nr:hypothetical protein RFI_00078 [Reticulomyxa filosa]|eukprot:ETO36991.1 hypothetical protein RFI_00078 [Reticulomyxa filosa]
MTPAEIARMQTEAKERVKTILKRTKTIPRELIFVGRNMNLVRANNKDLGSPVNRISILAAHAAQGLEKLSWQTHWKWKLQMWGLSFYYHWTWCLTYLRRKIFGSGSMENFEDKVEQRVMTQLVKDIGVGAADHMFAG